MKVMSYYFSVFGRGVGSEVRSRKAPEVNVTLPTFSLSLSLPQEKVMVEQFSLPLGGERGELVGAPPPPTTPMLSHMLRNYISLKL